MEGHLAVVDLLVSSGADKEARNEVCVALAAVGNVTNLTICGLM